MKKLSIIIVFVIVIIGIVSLAMIFSGTILKPKSDLEKTVIKAIKNYSENKDEFKKSLKSMDYGMGPPPIPSGKEAWCVPPDAKDMEERFKKSRDEILALKSYVDKGCADPFIITDDTCKMYKTFYDEADSWTKYNIPPCEGGTLCTDKSVIREVKGEPPKQQYICKCARGYTNPAPEGMGGVVKKIFCLPTEHESKTFAAADSFQKNSGDFYLAIKKMQYTDNDACATFVRNNPGQTC